MVIDPAIEEMDSIINKDVPFDSEGKFAIKLNLHLGPKYKIKVRFSSEKLVPSELVFELNYKNDYKLEYQKIYLGMQRNGQISGNVMNKLYLPIENALVKIYIESITNTISSLTDSSGNFLVKIPAPSNLNIVNAKIIVNSIIKNH